MGIKEQQRARTERRILEAILEFKAKSGGESPSFDEIARRLNISVPHVCRMIGDLKKRGFIKRDPNKRRSLHITKLPEAIGA